MAVTLDDRERAVLEAYERECERDPDGAFACYYHGIVSAVDGNVDVADPVCRRLKSRKLIDSDDRAGLHTPYWITDKGKEALA